VGDEVKVDDVLLMKPRSRQEAEERLGAAEANLERAKAIVERSRAQSEQANTDLMRARTLTERGTATAQTLERAELAVRLADRDLRARSGSATSNGRAELREVRLLRRSGRSAAVASGVTAGDAVIVYPGDRIRPGVRVAQRAR
jgi:multidrug resistance efflux pump